MACVWVAAGSRTQMAPVELTERAAFSFEVSGSALKDLHPGAVRRTRVTIANPYPFPITVHQVNVRVAGSSRWRCEPTAANLKVGPYRGSLPLVVAAQGRKTGGEFEVTMPNTVSDACQRTTFRLAFTAKASKAAR